MKKILSFIIGLFALCLISLSTYAYYDEHNIENISAFIYSPSLYELDSIDGNTQRYCEQVYLEANRRREFTQEELDICRDIFAIKNEQEMDYIRYVLGERGIYY